MMAENPNREWEEDALLGELARPLAHEFNNFLNTLLLQIAVLEHGQAPSELGAIRREAKEIANLVRQWQRYIKQPRPAEEAIDWNPIIREVAQNTDSDGVALEVSLSARPARVCGSPVDLKRLCDLIIGHALAAVRQRTLGKIRIETQAQADEVVLRVTDNREGTANQDTATWFDIRRTGQTLELAACQSLVRRLGGRIEAVMSAAHELTIQVILPTAR